MAISVNYSSSPWLITIPQSDLTLDTGTKYNLTVDVFWGLLKDYSDSADSTPYPIMFTRTAATASTPSITEIDGTYYALEFEDGAYSVNIIEGNTNVRDVEVKNQVSVGTNNTTGFINPTFLESGLFDGYVCIDETNGVTGTSKTAAGDVIGTRSAPSNNQADAMTIAADRGFYAIKALGTITLTGAASLDNYRLKGDNNAQSHIIFTTADTGDIAIEDAEFSGGMNGALYARDCSVGIVTGVGCTTNATDFIRCSFSGSVIMRADNTQAVNLLDCQAEDNNEFILDVNGTVGNISIHGYRDRIKIINVTSVVAIHFTGAGAEITLDSTCTAGSIEVHGDTNIIDNSTMTVDDDTSQALTWEYPVTSLGDTTTVGGMFMDHFHSLDYSQRVWIDPNGGSPGTIYPLGTRDAPVDSFADALIIAASRNLGILYVVEDATITATDDVSGYVVSGSHALKSQITLAIGCITTFTQFLGCTLTGTANGSIIVRDARVEDLWDFQGILHQVLINAGGIRLASSTEPTQILSCYSGKPGETASEIDYNGATVKLGVRDYIGGIKIVGSTINNEVTLDVSPGQVILNGTVTAGTYTIRGDCKLTDESTGTTITDDRTPKLVWADSKGKLAALNIVK